MPLPSAACLTHRAALILSCPISACSTRTHPLLASDTRCGQRAVGVGQIVAVEPHGEFARIGQALTSGMDGLTWRAHQRTGATSPAHQPGGAQKRQTGVPVADYGELDLGAFSAEDAQKVAEERELQEARALQTDNPYARVPKSDAADEASTLSAAEGTNTRPSWDIGAEDDAPLGSTAGNQADTPLPSSQATIQAQPTTAVSVPEGGWDLILCSFAFAERDVGNAAEGRHLKEVVFNLFLHHTRRTLVHTFATTITLFHTCFRVCLVCRHPDSLLYEGGHREAGADA